jgi:hypothetical protein
MFKKLLITLIFVLGSVSAFAQVDTAGMKRYDGAQDNRRAAEHVPDDTCCRLRGDCDDDGKVTVTDVEYLVNCLFLIHDGAVQIVQSGATQMAAVVTQTWLT